MDDTDQRTLTVYSDYVCPFCYLGKAALETYTERTETPPSVDWHQFDLRGYKRGPDGEIQDDVDDGKDDEYFAQVRENVERLKEEYDVEMLDIDELPDGVDSWDAQKLALHVQEAEPADTFAELHEALFVALWQEGRDIGDLEVLVDVAGSVGVPESEVREAVEDAALDERLRERFEAAKRRGVSGIPTFVYDDHAARGAVPPTQLERLVEGG